MRRLALIISSLLFVYLLGFVVLVSIQEKFIFLDEELAQDFQFQSDVPFEELNLNASDNGRLNALYFKADNAKGLILYFHGNRGNLTRWGDVVSPFTQFGYDVLVMDYRGFGKSTGPRNQKNLLADAELFYNWVLEKYNENEVILYGRSLGTGIASYLAGQHKPRKLILETPYYSLAKAAQRFYPIYPANWAMKYNFKSYQYLRAASCPIYIFHGTSDSVVPYGQGFELAKGLPADQVNLVTIEDGGHRNLSDYPLYWKEIEAALTE